MNQLDKNSFYFSHVLSELALGQGWQMDCSLSGYLRNKGALEDLIYTVNYPDAVIRVSVNDYMEASEGRLTSNLEEAWYYMLSKNTDALDTDTFLTSSHSGSSASISVGDVRLIVAAPNTEWTEDKLNELALKGLTGGAVKFDGLKAHQQATGTGIFGTDYAVSVDTGSGADVSVVNGKTVKPTNEGTK